MSAQIDSKPSKIIPANQPLIFTISDTGTTPDRFIAQVFEDSVEIAKLYLTPNTNNKVHFNLADIARDRVSVDDKIRDESATLLSYDAKPFTTGRNGLKKYEVKVGTYIGTTETLNQDSDTVYLIDGAEQISAGLHPSFADYYPTADTKTVWLTNRVAVDDVITIEAREEDEGCVAFLNDLTIIGGLAGQIKYEIKNAAGVVLATEYDTINSSNGAQLPNAADINQKLTYLMAYPKNLEQWISGSSKPSANPTWSYYEIQLLSGSGFKVSNVLRVNKLCTQIKHKNTQLAWTNSVGGWDSLTFTGRTQTEELVTAKEYQRQIGNWNASTYTFLPQAREKQAYQVQAKQSYKLTHVAFSFAELELLKYAFRSDNPMVRIGDTGVWQPVVMSTKNYNVKEAFSGMHSVTLSVELAQVIKC
jgi:hypothetical protein